MAKVVFYKSDDNKFFGWRRHHFDWEVGETIYTDGKKVTIFAVADYCGTLLSRIINRCIEDCNKVRRGTHAFISGREPHEEFALAVKEYCHATANQ